MKYFFESEEFNNVLEECETAYKEFRITKSYIQYQYDHSGITWRSTYEKTGGNKFWGHINKYTELFWNKFPEAFCPQRLKSWMIDLININLDDLSQAAVLDAKEFDRWLPFQTTPEFYLEYKQYFPIASEIPKGFSIHEAINYVNGLPYDENIRARWIKCEMSQTHFFRNKTFTSSYFRPLIKIEDGNAMFTTNEVIQHYFIMDHKKFELFLS